MIIKAIGHIKCKLDWYQQVCGTAKACLSMPTLDSINWTAEIYIRLLDPMSKAIITMDGTRLLQVMIILFCCFNSARSADPCFNTNHCDTKTVCIASNASSMGYFCKCRAGYYPTISSAVDPHCQQVMTVKGTVGFLDNYTPASIENDVEQFTILSSFPGHMSTRFRTLRMPPIVANYYLMFHFDAAIEYQKLNKDISTMLSTDTKYKILYADHSRISECDFSNDPCSSLKQLCVPDALSYSCKSCEAGVQFNTTTKTCPGEVKPTLPRKTWPTFTCKDVHCGSNAYCNPDYSKPFGWYCKCNEGYYPNIVSTEAAGFSCSSQPLKLYHEGTYVVATLIISPRINSTAVKQQLATMLFPEGSDFVASEIKSELTLSFYINFSYGNIEADFHIKINRSVPVDLKKITNSIRAAVQVAQNYTFIRVQYFDPKICGTDYDPCSGHSLECAPKNYGFECRRCPTGSYFQGCLKNCSEIDECASIPNICKESEKCINTIGSYYCLSANATETSQILPTANISATSADYMSGTSATEATATTIPSSTAASEILSDYISATGEVKTTATPILASANASGTLSAYISATGEIETTATQILASTNDSKTLSEYISVTEDVKTTTTQILASTNISETLSEYISITGEVKTTVTSVETVIKSEEPSIEILTSATSVITSSAHIQLESSNVDQSSSVEVPGSSTNYIESTGHKSTSYWSDSHSSAVSILPAPSEVDWLGTAFNDVTVSPSEVIIINSTATPELPTEYCARNRCEANSICIVKPNSPSGIYCQCDTGYRPTNTTSIGQVGCKDINECIISKPCDHKCINTVGSYSCSCHPGFKLGSDNKTCGDVNECASNDNPCFFQKKLCLNLNPGYMCQNCPTGSSFDTLINGCTAASTSSPTVGSNSSATLGDQCKHDTCGSKAKCYDQPLLSPQFFCRCRQGYYQDNPSELLINGDGCLPGRFVAGYVNLRPKPNLFSNVTDEMLKSETKHQMESMIRAQSGMQNHLMRSTHISNRYGQVLTIDFQLTLKKEAPISLSAIQQVLSAQLMSIYTYDVISAQVTSELKGI
ncbi:EGF-containing fibulin-like extracellular matrix protein 1 [Trichoplax sp. H2]|nr:EGF-containing fibulin-like extracellular matrix protein 1 [Trichoplax sp. H2]|eukprot:RDD44471.1 EGF-containing fibulin-like extracellular matrix protein 1 [Trichoplax sp. H2]